MTLEKLAPLGTRLWIVGQDTTQRDLIPRVVGVLLDQRPQTGDGVSTAVFGSRFGLIVGEGPVTSGRRTAKNLTIDRHCLRILPSLSVLSRLLKLRRLTILRAHILDVGDIGIVWIDRSQAIQIGTCK